MDLIAAPRLYIAGSAGGVGKSLLVIGLVQEFRRRGLSVSCAIHGPQLAQAALLRRISGRFTRVFDAKLLSESQILGSCYRASIGAEIILIEGRGGLFDGSSIGTGTRNSGAELSVLLGADVALVIDVRKLGASAAALYAGYASSFPGLRVGGSILNRYFAASSEEIFKAREAYGRDFQDFGQPSPWGLVPQFIHDAYLPDADSGQWDAVPSLSHQFLNDLGSLIRDYVDLDQIEGGLAQQSSLESSIELGAPLPRRTRIAYAEDSCFGVLFQENLELCRHYGAELIPFSPLADESLPQGIGAVYLTGANLRDYGEELAKNVALRAALKAFVVQGGALYSEGSSTAYLCEAYSVLTDEGPRTWQGIGIIDSRAKQKGVDTDYSEVVTTDDCILGRSGMRVRAIFANQWDLSESEGLLACFSVRRGEANGSTYAEGYSPSAQSVCSFGYLHFDSCPEFARAFVDAAEVVARVALDTD